MITENRLRIFDWVSGTRDTLGPGLRAVVWVQGCSLHCEGCVAPEMWSKEGGRSVLVSELAAQILDKEDIDGLSVSGGEPTEQPAAVGQLLSLIKAAGKNTWMYTGYTLEELVFRQDSDIDMMLSMVDVLVDGRYDQERSGTFRWRGSSDQRLIPLTDVIPIAGMQESTQGRVEITLSDGQLIVVGVPPKGLLSNLKKRLISSGISVRCNWGD